jgi:ankyrin repeat protein
MQYQRNRLEEALQSVDANLFSQLAGLYEYQRRSWICTAISKLSFENLEAFESSYPESFGVTLLHRIDWKDRDMMMSLLSKERGKLRDIHHWTPLHYAAARGIKFNLQFRFRRGADTSANDLVGWTSLHYASCHGFITIVRQLLRYGSDIEVKGNGGMASLHCASMKGHLDVVVELVKAGAAINVSDASGNTPLFWAAIGGHDKVVDYLYKAANKNHKDHLGRTAIHLAAATGVVEVVRLSLDKSRIAMTNTSNQGSLQQQTGPQPLAVDPSVLEDTDVHGFRPLHAATEMGHTDTIRLLLNAGAETEHSNVEGMPPLLIAVKYKQTSIVRLLVDAGAFKEQSDLKGNRPLHVAALCGRAYAVRYDMIGTDEVDQPGIDDWERYAEIARLLVEAGADTRAVDRRGKTALSIAASNGYLDVVPLLVEAAGTNLNDKDEDESSAISLAASRGHENVVRLLVEASADIESRDVENQPPLFHGASSVHPDIVRLLVEAGADKNARDEDNETPLQKATQQSHVDVVQLLEAADADEDAAPNRRI